MLEGMERNYIEEIQEYQNTEQEKSENLKEQLQRMIIL
jgi:hypothetical protein